MGSNSWQDVVHKVDVVNEEKEGLPPKYCIATAIGKSNILDRKISLQISAKNVETRLGNWAKWTFVCEYTLRSIRPFSITIIFLLLMRKSQRVVKRRPGKKDARRRPKKICVFSGRKSYSKWVIFAFLDLYKKTYLHAKISV